jgi:hypothetical protein
MKNHVYSIVSDHTPNIVVLLYGETVNISNVAIEGRLVVAHKKVD